MATPFLRIKPTTLQKLKRRMRELRWHSNRWPKWLFKNTIKTQRGPIRIHRR